MNLEIGMEVAQVSLGDERLDERCRILLETFAADPQASINAACLGWAETQAAYRFFDNDKVVEKKILQPLREATIERIVQHPVVLIVQDTTELDFTAHPPEGAGPNGTGVEARPDPQACGSHGGGGSPCDARGVEGSVPPNRPAGDLDRHPPHDGLRPSLARLRPWFKHQTYLCVNDRIGEGDFAATVERKREAPRRLPRPFRWSGRATRVECRIDPVGGFPIRPKWTGGWRIPPYGEWNLPLHRNKTLCIYGS
jgi:Transposase DNA-binding